MCFLQLVSGEREKNNNCQRKSVGEVKCVATRKQKIIKKQGNESWASVPTDIVVAGGEWLTHSRQSNGFQLHLRRERYFYCEARGTYGQARELERSTLTNRNNKTVCVCGIQGTLTESETVTTETTEKGKSKRSTKQRERNGE